MTSTSDLDRANPSYEAEGQATRIDHSIGDSIPATALTADRDGTAELPIHLSCRKCNHLHTSRRFRFFSDLRRHTRIQCDNCKYPMLGIGNNSTQTTLASIETLSRSSSLVPQIAGCTDTPLPPLDADDSRPGILHTISERHSTDGRSFGSSQQSDSLLPPRGSHEAIASPARLSSRGSTSAGISTGSTTVRVSEETARSSTLPRKRRFKRLRAFKDKLSQWIGRWKGTKVELKFDSIVPNVTFSRETTKENQHIQTLPTLVQPSAIPSSHLNPDEGTQTDQGDESDADRERARSRKEARIKAKRREQTLKADAQKHHVCQCSGSCQCMKGLDRLRDQSDRQYSINESDGQRDGLAVSDVPGHTLGSLLNSTRDRSSTDSQNTHRSWSLGRHVAFIGTHFPESERRSSSGANSSSILQGIHRRSLLSSSTRDSQGSTWIGSHEGGSSGSVTAASQESATGSESLQRRPGDRRSQSLPPVQQLLDQYGPSVRDALRDDAFHDQVQNLAREARTLGSPSIRADSLPASSISPLDPPQDDDVTEEPMLAHTSTTSLANLPDPGSSDGGAHDTSGETTLPPRSLSADLDGAAEDVTRPDVDEVGPDAVAAAPPHPAPDEVADGV